MRRPQYKQYSKLAEACQRESRSPSACVCARDAGIGAQTPAGSKPLLRAALWPIERPCAGYDRRNHPTKSFESRHRRGFGRRTMRAQLLRSLASLLPR